MLAVSVPCPPVFFTGSRVSCREGLLFLGYHAAHVASLAVDATQHHDQAELYGRIMLYAVIPATVLPLTWAAWHQGCANHHQAAVVFAASRR